VIFRDEDKIGKDEFMGEIIVDLAKLDMTSGSGNKEYDVLARPNKKDKVSGKLTIEYTYYSSEWKTVTTEKFTEDMTKQEEGQPPFKIDQGTLQKVIDSILQQQGDIDSPDKLKSILTDAGVLETILKSEFIASLEVTSFDSDATSSIRRETGTQLDEVLFSLFDADGNKKISAREIAIGIAMHSAASDKEKAALYFDLFDKNKDGKLTQSEMAGVYKMILDLWISALSVKSIGEMSGSIDFDLRWKAREDIEKISKSLKTQGLENTLTSNVRHL
jgi:Ca2+-binding EF-hand superfamily protein